jgi:hypothetical protein
MTGHEIITYEKTKEIQKSHGFQICKELNTPWKTQMKNKICTIVGKQNWKKNK